VWHRTQQKHARNIVTTTNTVTTRIKLCTMAQDGFPVDYHVNVTPDQPCVVSVRNKDRYGFDVVLTSLDGKPLAKGKFVSGI
jgi:hypothetical protein